MSEETKKIIFVVFILFIISIVLVPKLTRIFEGEKGKLKRIIYSAKSATEKENLLKCSSYVSFNYSDSYGNDRASLLFIAKNIFNDYDNITLSIRDLEIKVQNQDAIAEFEVVCVAKRCDTSEVEYDIINVKVIFKKETEDWKVIELNFYESEKNPYFKNIS
jgi:hypothetical protein